MPKFKGHPLVYPPRGTNMRRLRRYANGRWLVHNGEPALVFVERSSDNNDAVIHIAHCNCPYASVCPLGVALDYTSEKCDATTINRRPATARRSKTRKR